MAFKFGIAPVLLGLFGYVMVTRFTVNQEKQIELMQTHLADTKSMMDSSMRVLGVIQRVCLNTSKNDADRVACVSVVGPSR